jgi:7,8-dihydroneopterin aldolase/epimerase/oxygenase
MDKITLCDLEVRYRVGVTETERAQPQRLLLTLELERDLSPAASSDKLADTIDYYRVAQRLLALGQNRSWNLIEAVAATVADLVLREFKPRQVRVEVKKFIIPEARYVSVSLTRTAADQTAPRARRAKRPKQGTKHRPGPT